MLPDGLLGFLDYPIERSPSPQRAHPAAFGCAPWRRIEREQFCIVVLETFQLLVQYLVVRLLRVMVHVVTGGELVIRPATTGIHEGGASRAEEAGPPGKEEVDMESRVHLKAENTINLPIKVVNVYNPKNRLLLLYWGGSYPRWYFKIQLWFYLGQAATIGVSLERALRLRSLGWLSR